MEKLTRRDFLKLAAAMGAAVLAGCGGESNNKVESTTEPTTQPTTEPTTEPTARVTEEPTATETPTPTATETPTPTATATETPTETEIKIDLPYFEVNGVKPFITIDKTDNRVANNGPDEAGIDHKNPFMPTGAAWLVLADPGHYRVDSLTNVTDTETHASIETDIQNGAAFERDNYKGILTGREAVIPLWEAGGGQVLTGAQMQIELTDAQGNPVVFKLGRQENHGWVAILTNGLDRDHIRGTDNNRSLRLTNYDPGFTMWQAIPPGLFVSAQFAAQTIADAHGGYKDRGTSPGQGQDGVERVSILVAKILPEGIVYTVLQHNDPTIPWDKYKPDQFMIYANNTQIK